MPDTNNRSESSQASRTPVFLRASKPGPSALAALLDEWMQGDEAEQRETFELLRRSLDEDRPDGYKLFA